MNSIEYRQTFPEIAFVELHWRPSFIGTVNGVPLCKSTDWWDNAAGEWLGAELLEEIALVQAGAPNPIRYAIQ